MTGVVRPATEDGRDDAFGSQEKRQRTDDGKGTTTAAHGIRGTPPAASVVTTAAAAAVLAAAAAAAGFGAGPAIASHVTAAAAAVLASSTGSPDTGMVATGMVAGTTFNHPTTTSSASLPLPVPSSSSTTTLLSADAAFDGTTLRAEPPTLFQAASPSVDVGTAAATPPLYPYATTGQSPFATTGPSLFATTGPSPFAPGYGQPTALQSVQHLISADTMILNQNAAHTQPTLTAGTPWNMNFEAAPAGGYYTSGGAGGSSAGYGAAALAAAQSAAAMYKAYPAVHATAPSVGSPAAAADYGGGSAPSRPARAWETRSAAAGTNATAPQPDWMTSAALLHATGVSAGDVLADQEGNAYAFPQEIPSGALTSTAKPLHKVVDANNGPPTIWGYPGPGESTPSAYLQREVVEIPSKFRPPQVTVAADNDAWTFSTGTGAVYPTGTPAHLLSQAEDAAGMPAGLLTNTKSGGGSRAGSGPKHTVRAKDAHRRAEQRRRGEQSNEQAKLKAALGLQSSTSLADTLQSASNTVVALRETETMLKVELEKQRKRRAQLESQQEVRMVRTVMLQKQLRAEVQKGDESKFIGKVDNAQSEMTVALLAMGKGFGSGGNHTDADGNSSNNGVDDITLLA